MGKKREKQNKTMKGFAMEGKRMTCKVRWWENKA
jgi:hypothetical protein